MILIISYENFEQGTDPVIDWLLYYKAKFVKIITKDFYKNELSYKIDFLNDEIIVNGYNYFGEINSIWCRRYAERLNFNNFSNWPYSQAIYELNREQDAYFDALYNLLEQKNWLMNPRLGNINKVNTQRAALKAGLNTPDTIICNSRDELAAFHTKMGAIITKPIEFSGFYRAGSKTWATYTTEITADMIKKLPLNFVYSFFQRKIQSHYEVRVFYIDGDFYATCAIFDTDNRQADIKESYKEDYLHWCNYKLPAAMESKLHQLMQQLGLNTGSIDLLRSKEDNEYYFLEVNPGGQYSAPSDRSNYSIEKKIAEWLIKNDVNGRN